MDVLRIQTKRVGDIVLNELVQVSIRYLFQKSTKNTMKEVSWKKRPDFRRLFTLATVLCDKLEGNYHDKPFGRLDLLVALFLPLVCLSIGMYSAPPAGSKQTTRRYKIPLYIPLVIYSAEFL